MNAKTTGCEGFDLGDVVRIRSGIECVGCALGFAGCEGRVVDVDCYADEAEGFGVLSGKLAEAAGADDGEGLAGFEIAGFDCVVSWTNCILVTSVD